MKSIAGVLLAAGRSRRMGQPKALLHLAGPRIIDRLIATYTEALLGQLLVVASGETHHALVADAHPNVELIEGDPDAPMIDSLARALEAMGPGIKAVITQPIDAPFTTLEMLTALAAGGESAPRILCHQGKPGHPVLLPRRLFDEIEARPEGGLRALLAEQDVQLVEWDDDTPLADIDTEEDLRQWQTRADLGDLN